MRVTSNVDIFCDESCSSNWMCFMTKVDIEGGSNLLETSWSDQEGSFLCDTNRSEHFILSPPHSFHVSILSYTIHREINLEILEYILSRTMIQAAGMTF